jgi:oxygen-independent coproporphyrinogen-3 oxidase
MINPFELVFTNIVFFYPDFRRTDTADANYDQLRGIAGCALRDGTVGQRGFLVYVHIPYCTRICRFCGYHRKRLVKADELSSYVDRLLAEIRQWASMLDGPRQTVSNIYFGGGTPTLLSSRDLFRIVETLHASFRISERTEFDIESDLSSLRDEAKLRTFRAAGIKRISFGLQSLDDDVRKKAGIYDAGEVENMERCCDGLRAAGYGVNCDLMFGLPGQSAPSFLRDIRRGVSDLAAEHFDLLEFFPQQGSYFGRRFSEFADVTADRNTRKQMYVEARRYLIANGFKQHTLSDFWRDGAPPSSFKVRLYRNADILGFGASAHGMIAGCAYRNAQLDEGYMDRPADSLPLAFIRPLPAELLRTRSLVLLPKLLTFSTDDFPGGVTSAERALLGRFVEEGRLENTGDTYVVTEAGMLSSADMMLDTLRAAAA